MEPHKPDHVGSPTEKNIGLIAVISSCLMVFFSSFMTSGINIALPHINQEFHADAILLSWVATSYLLVIGVLLIPVGRLADISGIKKTFLLGIVIYAIACTIAAFSNSIIMLIICRAVQGVGSAMSFVTSTAMVTVANPSNKRGRMLGITTACVYTGYSVGPLIGGLLTEHLGWRGAYSLSISLRCCLQLHLFCCT